RTKTSSVRDEFSFQHIHPVAARMSVPGIDYSRGITNQANQSAGFRIGVKFLTEKRAANSFVESFFPRHRVSVDHDQLALIHDHGLPEIVSARKNTNASPAGRNP